MSFIGSTTSYPVVTPAGTDTIPIVQGGVVKQALISTLGAVASDPLAPTIHAATGKTTPVDADELPITDSAASYVLKKLTFANLAAWVWSKLGPLIAAGTGKTTPVDADSIAISDSAASDASKKLTLINLKAFLKTYFDTIYGTGSGDVVGPAGAVNNRVAFFDGTTGKLIKDSGLALSGSNTGDQSSVSGNAGTATALATSRNIDGQAFNGTADITVIAPGTHAATGKTTPVDADEMPLVDSAASNVLKKVTWANLKATLKTYFDTLYGSGGGGTGPGAPAVAWAQYPCVALEPDAIEAVQVNGFSYAVSGAATKLVLASWGTRLGASGRMEVRNPQKYMPLRGVTLNGLGSGSCAIIIDPTLATYTSAWDTYHTRLKALDDSAKQTIAFTAVSQRTPFLPGAYGAVIVQYTCYDLAWIALRPRGGTTIGFNLWDEISDSATQRMGDTLLLPISKQCAGMLESSATGSSPLGAVTYVLLPSTWSAIADPNTYSFRDDFMGASLDTASTWSRTVSTAGNIEINTTYQWCKAKGNTSWGTNGLRRTTTAARSNGRQMIVDVFVPVGTNAAGGLGIFGWSDGSGYSYTNFAHGLNFSSTNILNVFENSNARGTVGSGFTDGAIYRVRITQGTSSATYEIQGGPEYPAIGSGSWTNITPGTSSSSTTPLTPAFTAFGALDAYVSDVRVIG